LQGIDVGLLRRLLTSIVATLRANPLPVD